MSNENIGQPIPDPITDPIKDPIAGELNISDWKKMWEEFKKSIIGKTVIQEIIKMAIVAAVSWAIKELPGMI